MNLVGHVAVALAPDAPPPSTEFLVGCMLPDLAAIARVRVSRPGGDLGAGVAFHHACDAVFHELEWFRATNRALRDALVDAGIDSGPARASSHAGVEMLLDGRLVTDEVVDSQARVVLDAVNTGAPGLAPLAPVESRDAWVERLQMIGSSLDPGRYQDAQFVAERLHRMTSGRRRIELRDDDVDTVASALRDFQAGIGEAAPDVMAEVRRAVPTPLHPG
ncbi:MAG TPA: hypothetical protein VK549_18565 [Acidimicrobiia bacterium]|nr:hypothetical protein [Acidimicrobiia bacterium]